MSLEPINPVLVAGCVRAGSGQPGSIGAQVVKTAASIEADVVDALEAAPGIGERPRHAVRFLDKIEEASVHGDPQIPRPGLVKVLGHLVKQACGDARPDKGGRDEKIPTTPFDVPGTLGALVSI